MKRGRRFLCACGAVWLLLWCAAPVQAEPEKPASVSARSCVVMDALTGTVLFEKLADEKRAMASTTKIMTTLLALENADLTEEITATKEMVTVEGSGMGLQAGDRITYGDLCRGMMLASGNDAANAVAVALAGSLPAFADKMNQKAARIGMTNTHFVTPSGLDDDLHYSTAYDMALLTAYALQNPDFRALAASATAPVSFGDPPAKRTLTNHNRLLASYEGCIGVKTGFTKKAGRCLVSAAQRDGATLICVTLRAPDDWDDHRALLDYGFSQMERLTFDGGRVTLPVTGGSGGTVRADYPAVSVSVPRSQAGKVTFGVQAAPFLYAPVAAGRTVGQAAVCLDGAVLAAVPVTALEAVPAIPPPGLWERFMAALIRVF